MALPLHATMPLLGAKDQIFELDRVDYLSPEARGRIGGVSAGWPLWKTTITFGTLSRMQSDTWRAFYTAQRGQQRTWYGFDIARRMPINYLTGLPPGFSGACAGWTQTIDSNNFAVLTLTGLPPGFVIAPTDYVDFRWGGFQRALVRAMEGAIADGAGILTVTVEPPVHTAVPAGAVAHLDNPACLMKFVMQESSLGAVGRRGAIESGTLVAIQDIIA